jgi:hypothetical protein
MPYAPPEDPAYRALETATPTRYTPATETPAGFGYPPPPEATGPTVEIPPVPTSPKTPVFLLTPRVTRTPLPTPTEVSYPTATALPLVEPASSAAGTIRYLALDQDGSITMQAFAVGDDGMAQSAPERLGALADWLAGYAYWSPDGNRIAFLNPDHGQVSVFDNLLVDEDHRRLARGSFSPAGQAQQRRSQPKQGAAHQPDRAFPQHAQDLVGGEVGDGVPVQAGLETHQKNRCWRDGQASQRAGQAVAQQHCADRCRSRLEKGAHGDQPAQPGCQEHHPVLGGFFEWQP